MTKEDIIRMAREVWGDDSGKPWHESAVTHLEAFASCHPECDRPACVHTRKAVEAEREACAVIAFNAKTYIEAANAIRARGQG